MNKNWILGKKTNDLLWINLPGLIGLLISFNLPEKSAIFLIYYYFVLMIPDTGHVYFAFWRTIFRKEERESSPRYWIVPLAAIFVVFLWVYLKIPYLWSAVVYFGFYHHFRQLYGFICWYEKLNKRFCKISNRFMYALTIFPFVIFHFRESVEVELYSDHDFIFFPSPQLFQSGLVVYVLLVGCWIIFEIGLLKKGIRELNRFLAILTPSIVSAICFLKGNSTAEIMFPILMLHGFQYWAATGISLKRLNSKKYLNLKKVFLTLGLSSIGLVVIEFIILEPLVTLDYSYILTTSSIKKAFLTAIFLTPVLCHFIWDAYIWRHDHKDAPIIFNPDIT